MRCRRAIRTLLVFVLLGVVATVLTSWAIHGMHSWRVHRGWQIIHEWDVVPLQDSPFWRGTAQTTPDDWSPFRVQPGGSEWDTPDWARFRSIQRVRASGWRAFHQSLYTDHVSVEWLCLFEAGWPLRSMRHGLYAGFYKKDGAPGIHTHSPRASLHGGVQLLPWAYGSHSARRSPQDTRNPFDRFALPLLPIWPGFVLNTAVYGVLMFALVRGVRTVRRALRRRRGRCVGCGYSRDGLDPSAACPECGAGVAIRPASPPRRARCE